MPVLVLVKVPFDAMYLLQILSLSNSLSFYFILLSLLSQQLYLFANQSSLKMITKAKSKRFLASSLLALVAAIASAHAEYAGGTNPSLRGMANPSAEDLFPMSRRLTTQVPNTPVCYEYNGTGVDLTYRHSDFDPRLSIIENCPVTSLGGDCSANDLTPLDAE